ncbi:ANAPC2 [Cordylochernes scorpioides]|uniref:Anaphase-promoting complex subunit 2 n=1 Tax=Cordylochernes scorpioides TaxID=51811 RepID=A0ABY6KXV8_9ARAC|nr:ANAPC2 [Cordylochernes scorpioides]
MIIMVGRSSRQLLLLLQTTLKPLDDLHETLSASEVPPDVRQSLQHTWHRPLIAQAYSLLSTFLFVHVPSNFSNLLLDFYSKIFRVYHYQSRQKSHKHDISGGSLDASTEEEEDDSLQCRGCESEVEMCQCQALLSTLHTTTQHLPSMLTAMSVLSRKELTILDKMTYEVMLTVIQDQMETYIKETCKGNFETHYMKPLLKDHLKYLLHEHYVKVRMEQMFNIIIEFPESLSAIDDLLECSKVINFRSQLISSVKDSFVRRLLHPAFSHPIGFQTWLCGPGVNTADILTAFVSTIKTLRILDPTGAVLQQVAEPVCHYLRKRSNTVRCIVASIMDDNSTDLAGELLKSSDVPSGRRPKVWQPEPLDGELGPELVLAYLSRRSSCSRTMYNGHLFELSRADCVWTDSTRGTPADLMSLLSNIYGSSEVFVEEYRSLLAERLLSSMSFNCDRERRHLELLKLKFGASALYVCEVMLKDVTDSHRISLHINSEDLLSTGSFSPNYNVHAMIVSIQFWPTFREGKLQLPDKLWQPLRAFRKAFETLKGNRSLVWKPHLGLVHMVVNLQDRALTFTVSPVHAVLLWHFQDKEERSVTELGELTGLPAGTVRRKMAWWAGQGVVEEVRPDVFLVLEERKARYPATPAAAEEEEEGATVATTSSDHKEAELQMYWTYVVGMLSNLDSLPLDRIHTMLRMFIPAGAAGECSLGELKHMLERKVRAQELCNGLCEKVNGTIMMRLRAAMHDNL